MIVFDIPPDPPNPEGRPPHNEQRPAASMTESPLDWRLVALLTRLQFELNCLGSVSIEVPSLRPAFERLQEAIDG